MESPSVVPARLSRIYFKEHHHLFSVKIFNFCAPRCADVAWRHADADACNCSLVSYEMM